MLYYVLRLPYDAWYMVYFVCGTVSVVLFMPCLAVCMLYYAWYNMYVARCITCPWYIVGVMWRIVFVVLRILYDIWYVMYGVSRMLWCVWCMVYTA